MAYADVVLADSPAAFWRLEETSGSTIADSSGNGRTLTATSATLTGSTGLTDLGSGATLDGSSSHLSADITPIPGTASVWSVEFWTTTTTGGGSTTAIVAEANGGSSTSHWYVGTSGGFVTAAFRVSATLNQVTGTVVINDNAPHHVVVTFNGTTGAVSIYVDGALDTTGTSATGTYAPTRFSIGRLPRSSITGYYAGTVDEVALYESTLSPARILAHYESGTGVLPPASVNAGADQTVQVDSGTVTLGPAVGDPSGGTYSWAQTSGTAVTLSGASTATATYPAPSTAGARTFQVTYTPTAGDPVTDSVVVTHTLPAAPTASHTKTNVVEVDATASSAPTTLVQASGDTVTITEPTTDVYRVELPASFETNIVLTLTAEDAYGQTTQQAVTITPAGGTTVIGGPKVRVGGVYV